MPAAHSPSPPPQPPVQLTPGPRATALHNIFTTALAATLKANSYKNFAACFPTPAKQCPGTLEHVWKQLNEKLEKAAAGEFEDICKEKGVVAALNELDRLVKEGEARRDREGLEARPVA
jgi:kinetochore protein NNF1